LIIFLLVEKDVVMNTPTKKPQSGERMKNSAEKTALKQ